MVDDDIRCAEANADNSQYMLGCVLILAVAVFLGCASVAIANWIAG